MIPVAVACILKDGRLFLQRRHTASAHFPGLWELPGGKVEPGETPEEALCRELREELAWSPASVRALPARIHDYPGLTVALHPFICQGMSHPSTALAWGWFTLGEAGRLPVPEATRRLLVAWERCPEEP